MSKEYYQMGWTLDDNYEEDYFCSRDNHRYFIKKNTTPMIATLSAEGIVPTLRWTRRMSNGDVLIAQDFENGRTLDTKDMTDPRIPEILRKVHSSPKLKRIMQAQGYQEETAHRSLANLKSLITDDLRKNLKKNEIIKLGDPYRYVINNLKTLETWSGKKYSEVLYDSDIDGKDSSIFRNKIMNHNQLYFIIIDSNDNVFGHYHPGVINKISSNIYNDNDYYYSCYNDYDIRQIDTNNSHIYSYIGDYFSGIEETTLTGNYLPPDSFTTKRIIVIQMK